MAIFAMTLVGIAVLPISGDFTTVYENPMYTCHHCFVSPRGFCRKILSHQAVRICRIDEALLLPRRRASRGLGATIPTDRTMPSQKIGIVNSEVIGSRAPVMQSLIWA